VILLVRHARAGRRGTAGVDDSLRPLDRNGRKQASAVAAMLAGRPIERILSSPYRRCIETVEPLAQATGLEIEQRDELAEGRPASEVLSLIDELPASGDAVLCSHGDVIGELIGYARPVMKGSVWVLDPEHDMEPRGYLIPE